MERAVPLRSKSKTALGLCLGLTCLALTACARSAPELPTDYASVNATSSLSDADFEQVDINATCEEVAAEKEGVLADYAMLEQQITSSRQEEQTAGYLSAVLFPPAALAIDRKEDEKERLDEMQARLDTLSALQRYKSCRQTPETADTPISQ